MKEYYVEVPVVLKLMVGVRAEDENDAMDKIFNSDIMIKAEEVDSDNLEFVDYEWEMHEKVVEGNVYYGIINRVYIKEESDC